MDWEARAIEAEAALSRALERIVELEAQRRNLADRDPLTGLMNRAAFEDELAALAATSARYGPEGAVIFVRVAGLQDVRAVAGLDAADDLLVAATDRCQAVVRATDVVARWGADEVAVLLPRALPGHANAVAGKLVGAVVEASTMRVGAGAVRAHVGTAHADRSGDPDALAVRGITRMLAAARTGVPIDLEPAPAGPVR